MGPLSQIEREYNTILDDADSTNRDNTSELCMMLSGKPFSRWPISKSKLTPKPALGAHWFQITVTWIKERILGRDKKHRGGPGRVGEGEDIMSKSTWKQIPNQEASKKNNLSREQHSKQANIRYGKLWKVTQKV